jgi:hypothetical protein
MVPARFLMVALILSLPAWILGCGQICSGTTVSTVTLHAELAAATVFTANVLTGDGAGDAGPWHVAIDDASAAGPGSGTVRLTGLQGEVLSLRLPFPLASGQIVPIIRELAPSAGPAFAFQSSGDATQVGAALERCPTGAMDVACGLAERQEVIGGTLRVDSVRPLRAHVTASVSYGDATALAALALDGDLIFAATEGTQCLD